MFTFQTTIAYCVFCPLLFTLCSLCKDLMIVIQHCECCLAKLFFISMGDYMQAHISKCGHTLEINTFILINLI